MTQLLKEYGNEMEKQIKVVSLEVILFFSATFLSFLFERDWKTITYIWQSTANSNSFKIAQKTAFEVKGRLYTTGKVIQRLFIIDLYT